VREAFYAENFLRIFPRERVTVRDAAAVDA
jgi:hypothetical protein